jgi:hypothetical protein
MPSLDRKNIKKQLGLVTDAIASYSQKLDSIERFQEILRSVDNLNRATPWADLDISDFFREVGAGMIAAQEELDERTLQGLAEGRSPAGGSVYRIPKVSAEIQFALRSKKGKKFNIVLFGEETEQKEERQHRVSFDIVAAPPPPDLLAHMESLDIDRVFVTDPDDREVVRQRLLAFHKDKAERTEPHWAELLKRIKQLVEAKRWLRVLILKAANGWVCVSPRLKPSPDLEVLYVDRAALFAAIEGIEEELAGPPAMPKRLLPLIKDLVRLAGIQANALAALKKSGGPG